MVKTPKAPRQFLLVKSPEKLDYNPTSVQRIQRITGMKRFRVPLAQHHIRYSGYGIANKRARIGPGWTDVHVQLHPLERETRKQCGELSGRIRQEHTFRRRTFLIGISRPCCLGRPRRLGHAGTISPSQTKKLDFRAPRGCYCIMDLQVNQ